MRSLDVGVDERLARLIDELDETTDALRRLPPDDGVVGAARDAAAVATLRLDGSTIEDVPDEIGPPPAGTGTGPARGGWLEVLRSGTRELVTVPDEVLLAVEHRGARAGLDASDLAAALRSDLPTSLAALHTRVTDGLLHPSVAGRPRRSEQAVHDASFGRVLFFPVDPARVPERLDRLAAWSADADVHSAVRSGVVHHQLLDIHPFEAANGRTARIAARLLLAADHVDPARVTQPERALLGDPIGYLDEVGHCRRLGDPGAFVERWVEALLDGAWAARRTLLDDTVGVPTATRHFLGEVGEAPFTLVDHRRAFRGSPQDADAALADARRAGVVRWVHGSRGLRWRRAEASDD